MEHANYACYEQSLMCLVFLPAMHGPVIRSDGDYYIQASFCWKNRQAVQYLLRIQLWVIATFQLCGQTLIDEKEERMKQEEKVSGGVWGIE